MIPVIPTVGEVWAVNTGNSLASRIIRAGAAFEGKPGNANHVVGVNKVDIRGVWWGLEGRPGGVGWVDLRQYQHHTTAHLGNSNTAQPLSTSDRMTIAKSSLLLRGTDYDWAAIADDTVKVFHIPELAERLQDLWEFHSDPSPDTLDPGHVVFSSYYACVYTFLRIPNPASEQAQKDWRTIEPADWWMWNDSQGWK